MLRRKKTKTRFLYYFPHKGKAAFIDNEFKLFSPDYNQGEYELYDLSSDPQETKNLIDERPDIALSLRKAFEAWNRTVESSLAGKDYPEGKLTKPDPKPIYWIDKLEYKPYLNAWRQRPEYILWKRYVTFNKVKSRFSEEITRLPLYFTLIIMVFLIIWLWKKKRSV